MSAGTQTQSEVRGHDDVLAGLWRAETDGRLHHAFLFEGPSGIGKQLAALRLVTGLFCDDGPGPPCGRCGPCRRMVSGGEELNHPDVLVVDALAQGEEEVRVAYIAHRESDARPVPLRRTVEGFLDLKRQEAPYRAVILRDADRMNTSAQNALLKTLEEPRDGTLLILVASNASTLLDTTISRVTRVGFGRLDTALTERILADLVPELEPDERARYARWAKGSPGHGLELVAQRRATLVDFATRVVRGELGPLAATTAIWSLELSIQKSTERAKDRERLRFVLDLLLEWALDLARLAAGHPPEALVHGPELAAALANRPAGWQRQLGRLTEQLEGVRRDIEHNLTPAALLDTALLALAELAPSSR